MTHDKISQIRNKLNTTMHSSRMRTACLLPVSPSMHCGWGVSAPGGVGGVGVSVPRGLLLGGVCSRGRGCSQEGEGEGVCSWPGGLLLGGLSHYALGQTPCEQNDIQVQKYYLAPNFVCGR